MNSQQRENHIWSQWIKKTVLLDFSNMNDVAEPLAQQLTAYIISLEDLLVFFFWYASMFTTNHRLVSFFFAVHTNPKRLKIKIYILAIRIMNHIFPNALQFFFVWILHPINNQNSFERFMKAMSHDLRKQTFFRVHCDATAIQKYIYVFVYEWKKAKTFWANVNTILSK